MHNAPSYVTKSCWRDPNHPILLEDSQMAEMKYIVSDEHKFIYFVIQKVACSSIKTALLPLFDFDVTGQETDRSQDGFPVPGIHKIFAESDYEINKNQLIKELNGKYRDYFKFAFVRNPWDRLVSCYSQKLVKGGAGLRSPADAKIGFYTGMPFAEFVEAVSTIRDNQADRHFKSQYKVVCGRGKDNPIMADFVGHYENLAADFDVVAERIGGTHELQLPHLLSSKHRRHRRGRPYTEFYDDKLRDLVHERYLKDIEKFGYSF